MIDGRTLVYAAVGDSCGVFARPSKGGGAMVVEELVPEHSPTYVKDWAERLHNTGVLAVYDHPDMFGENAQHAPPRPLRTNFACSALVPKWGVTAWNRT